jgi:uncharacterized membrane protein
MYSGYKRKQRAGYIVALVAGVALLATMIATSGCAAKTPLAKARASVVSVVGLIGAIDDVEQQAYAEKLFTAERHVANSKIIVAMIDGALAYETAVRAWSLSANDPEPDAVRIARRAVIVGLAELLAANPDNKNMQAVAASLRIAMGIVEVTQ